MNRTEFLDTLRSQLSGQMHEGKVAAHVRYYEDYIFPFRQIFSTFKTFVIFHKYTSSFLTIMLSVNLLTKCFFNDTMNTSIEKLLNTDGSWS